MLTTNNVCVISLLLNQTTAKRALNVGTNMRNTTTAATAAKEIRKELKAKFPTVKFTVKSKSYSGGNSINITWFNGVTESDVNEITSKYEMGHFDGMTDMYEYSNSRDDLPQVKYLFLNRNYTQEVMQSVVDQVAKGEFEVKVQSWDNSAYIEMDYNREGLRREIYDRLNETVF